MGRYRQGVFDLTVDSSFNPFSMQEMMTPFLMYKDAFEKQEAAYDELNQKAGDFKYLAETLPEGSKARAIYEGYANDLEAQARDFSSNGLSMNNRRALTDLKRRYSGEIGRLEKANAALDEEKKLRRQMNAKDSSMLYANDNLSIDNFLDGQTPNLYNISGTELYTRGAAAGRSASSRVFSAGDEGSTLNGYYRKWVERNGYSKESIDAFRANASAIPELQQAADAILAERGVLDNLNGANLDRARQSVLNGIIDGAVYSEKVNPVRDPGVMSASERDSSARGWASYNLSKEQKDFERAASGYTYNEDTKKWEYDPDRDLAVQKAAAVAKAKGTASGNGSTGGAKGGAGRTTQASTRLKINWKGNNPADTNGDADNDYEVETVANDESGHPGALYSYDRLPTYVKKAIAPLIGDGMEHLYDYYFQPFNGGFFSDTEASVELVPRKVVMQSNQSSNTYTGGTAADNGLNDIPE